MVYLLAATPSNSLLRVLDCWSAALKAFYSEHLCRFMPALGTDVCRFWTVGVNCYTQKRSLQIQVSYIIAENGIQCFVMNCDMRVPV